MPLPLEGQQRRTRAGETGRDLPVTEVVEERGQLRHERSASLLVETVVQRDEEQIGFLGERHHRSAPWPTLKTASALRPCSAALPSLPPSQPSRPARARQGRDRDVDPVGAQAVGEDGETSERRGGRVVGMALQLRRVREDRVRIRVLAPPASPRSVSERDTRDGGRRGRAQAAFERDPVDAVQRERRERRARVDRSCAPRVRDRAAHHVGAVGRELVGTLALPRDAGLGLRCRPSPRCRGPARGRSSRTPARGSPTWPEPGR